MSQRWGLVGLALVAVLLLTALLWIADLFGFSKNLVNSVFLVISIIGYAIVGLKYRTSQPEQYYVAGRSIPAVFNGMATAADWMSAASFIGLTGLLMSDGFLGDGLHAGGAAYVLGWTGGFCVLGFLFASKIRQSQAITIPELIGELFGNSSVRWIGAVGSILCSSLYLVAQIYGIGLVASMLTGLTFELGVFIALGGILLCSFLGGMRAVTWTQVIQCVVIVVSMIGVSLAVAFRSHGHGWVPWAAMQSMQQVNARALQIDADMAERSTRSALESQLLQLDIKIADPKNARQIERQQLAREIKQLKESNAPLREIHKLEANPVWRDLSLDQLVQSWNREREEIKHTLMRPTGFAGHGSAGANPGLINTLALFFCLMIGTASLPHILVRSFTAESAVAAEKSVAWSLLFVVIVYMLASSLAVILKDSVLTELVGARIDLLPEWANQLKLRKLALLNIYDWNGDGIVQWGDIRLLNDYLVLAVPETMHLSPVFTGLIAAGALAAALSTADGLLLTISNSLAHDFPVRWFSQSGSPLRQVMLSKILLMLVALAATWLATYRPVDILYWITCAFSMAASTFFPVLLLGLHWRRMSSAGAVAAMVSGLLVCAYYIGVNHPALAYRLDLSPEQTRWLGLEPYCAGVFGVPVGLLSAWLGSLLFPNRLKKAL